MSLTFAQAHFALSFVSQIAPSRADAFEARLKQWQKMGFPEGINVGRGVRASYGATQVYQLLFMLKLLHVGLTPERAQRVVLAGWTSIKDAIAETVVDIANRETRLHYSLIQLDALSELKEPPADHMHVFVDTFTSEEVQDAFMSNEEYRSWLEQAGHKADDTELRQQEYISFLTKNRLATCICIEIDSLLILLWAAFGAMRVSPDVFSDEISEWVVERHRRGRAEQQAAGRYDNSLPNSSINRATQTLDVIEAARLSLLGLDDTMRLPDS